MEDQNARNGRESSWTLLTGHGHVLVAITRDPKARLRDISARVGLTERSVQLIVADLVAAGYLVRHRAGRRNHYTVNPHTAFRHPDQNGHRVGPLLDMLAATEETGSAREHAPEPADGQRTGIASHLPHLGRAHHRPRTP